MTPCYRDMYYKLALLCYLVSNSNIITFLQTPSILFFTFLGYQPDCLKGEIVNEESPMHVKKHKQLKYKGQIVQKHDKYLIDTL